MKEELEAIVDSLAQLAMKYGKEYVNVDYINGCGSASIRVSEPDYEETHVFKIYREENIKWEESI